MATPEPVFGDISPAEALAFFRQKKLLPTNRWTDVMRGEHDRAFVVAGAVKMELLADLRAAVERAIADGTTITDFRRAFDAAVTKAGWTYKGERGWRTSVIYQTNLRTAYAAGRLAQMQDPDVLAARPYWLYRHGGSATPRPDHLSWNNVVLRADDPWWRTHYAPNGWGCSCSVFALSADDVRARGLRLSMKAPDDGTYEVVDRETGETIELPKGIERGWDYTPGEAWLESQTPRFVDAWPDAGPASIPAAPRLFRGSALLPPARPLPASIVLPGDLPDEQYFNAFTAELGDALVDGILTDGAGERLALGRSLFEDRNGRLKIRKRDRHRFVRLLARTLADPDEVWVRLEPINRVPGLYQVFRRYVARWTVEGEAQPAFALFEVSSGHEWTGTTAFQTDEAYVEAQRLGIRIYRRS